MTDLEGQSHHRVEELADRDLGRAFRPQKNYNFSYANNKVPQFAHLGNRLQGLFYFTAIAVNYNSRQLETFWKIPKHTLIQGCGKNRTLMQLPRILIRGNCRLFGNSPNAL